MMDLQAVVTGYLAGSLMRAEREDLLPGLRVEVIYDAVGNYAPRFRIVAPSGTRLLVRVELDTERLETRDAQ